jgi:mono/diheme cytochrome c family protein
MRVLKLVGKVVAGLLVLIVAALGVLYVLSQRRIGKSYTVAGHDVAVPTDSAALARGEHVANLRGCIACHGEGLGGAVFIDVAPVARLHAANLTTGAGGVAAGYREAKDWERSIRQGVNPAGRALLFMPSHEFYGMSDDDLGALIAYIRSRTPVDRAFPDQSVGPIGRALFLSGKLPLVPAELVDHEAPRPTPPVPGVTPEYGRYLAATCTGCHGEGLSGGPIPGAPPEMAVPLNITPDTVTGIGKWTEAEFATAVRTGMRPNGIPISSDMPFKSFAHFTDDEIAAVWAYVRSVPAKAYGGR